MTQNLVRLSTLVDLDSDFRDGERRIIHQNDNLVMWNLFMEESQDVLDYYIYSTPQKPVPVQNMPPGITTLGDHECNLLNKIMQPLYPVICIYGRMGSGKSTTMKLLIDKVIRQMPCDGCPRQKAVTGHECKRMIARIDFKGTVLDSVNVDAAYLRLLKDISERLWNKCSIYFDEETEYHHFWKYLMEINDSDNDDYIEKVFGSLIANIPRLRDEIKKETPNFALLASTREKLRETDPDWYLRYMVLMWRYLLATQFDGHRECAMVVLDNIDSLPTALQRRLVTLIHRSAYSNGPTFVMLVREETLARTGENDHGLDHVEHRGPAPVQVVLGNLEKYSKSPRDFFRGAPMMAEDDLRLVREYLDLMVPKLRNDRNFYAFMNSIAGKSIRNALYLAQSILELPVGEMRRTDINPHYVIRAMLRDKGAPFQASPQSHIVNPFDVESENEGRYLTKIRVLRYIESQGGQCNTPKLISMFDYFGFSGDVLWHAIQDLVRNESQLLTSDGYDPTYKTWRDDQDTLYLTEIGKGYSNHLIYDIDFVGEVMLDARVPSNFSKPALYRDQLCEKLDVLYHFLDDVHATDVSEVTRFNKKMSSTFYKQNFGPRLITLDIIQNMYQSVGKLMQSQYRRRPDHGEEYIEIVEKFTSLLRVIEKANNDLLGVTDTLSEFQIG